MAEGDAMIHDRTRLIAWAAFVLLLLDRAGKAYAQQGFAADLAPWLRFALFENTGIAFSVPITGWLFWPPAIAALIGLTAIFVRFHQGGDHVREALVGGVIFAALSNLFDKAVYGAVIDFLIFFDRSAVNIADGVIVAGVLALVLWPKSAPSK